jgi:hypothetical protein
MPQANMRSTDDDILSYKIIPRCIYPYGGSKMSQSLLLALLQIPQEESETAYIGALSPHAGHKRQMLMSTLYDALTGVYDRSNPGAATLRADIVGTLLSAIVRLHDIPHSQDLIKNAINTVQDPNIKSLLEDVFNDTFMSSKAEFVVELRSLMKDRFNVISNP